jgi:glycine dehydrogenase
MNLDASDFFEERHLGPRPEERDQMLKAIGVASLDQLIDETVPRAIRRTEPLRLDEPMSESQLLSHLRTLARTNRAGRSYIGMGYYGCHTPSVILRNVLENPSWYTPYTPYQAEIAQGRLEALLNFQTMVADLTAMEVANASLLDEATAAAEAMIMLYRLQHKRASDAARTFFVANTVFPQTLEVLQARAEPLGITLQFGDPRKAALGPDVFGALIQYPDGDGAVFNAGTFIGRAHEEGLLVAVAADLLSLTLLTPPGALGADVVFGNSQRFGVPMGYGGPHAAFFAAREAFVREMPGRIIGVSVDRHGRPACRMALQTREQHIRREKAKSNICTAQALLATMAGMYAVYHGPDGLRRIGRRVHALTRALDAALRGLGYTQLNDHYFDTLKVRLPDASGRQEERLRARALEAGLNFRYFDRTNIGLSLDETASRADVAAIARVFAEAADRPAPDIDFTQADPAAVQAPAALIRHGGYLAHPVFNTHHSETEMMRYLKSLERKDMGLNTSMIPLGSCTMKLNSATEMRPVTWPEFGDLHPFVPPDQAAGYARIFQELEQALCEITGFAAVSLQPNSGAQGELAGLMVIHAYHMDRGEAGRRIVLIPASAHGTNPASAVMAGLEVVVVQCDAQGNIDLADLKAKAEAHRQELSALMVTYPSTHGVFEESIREVCGIVHRHGGQVYMDGANLNAQVGLTSPGVIGADVCHINLHKTFSIPHGGGGPGMGPIAVAKHLVPFLPGHRVVKQGGPKSIHSVSAAPWGSASILLISYAYIKLLGAGGVTEATRYAILNANYIKARLDGHFRVLFTGPRGRVAHEAIFDLRPLKNASGIDEIDVAKRLMDYGFHAPTVSWPVPGTIMIEPTESEDKEQLDRFCDALISIKKEIDEVIAGRADRKDNVLKNAPHTAAEVAGDTWTHPYSREQAAFPLPWVRADKFWPAVGRIDNPHGDRNLVCTCPPVEE